ncbi:hypothetical protein ACFQ0Q_03285 [Streptomyces aureus]
MAQRLLEHGAQGVLLTDLDAGRLEATVKLLAGSHGERVGEWRAMPRRRRIWSGSSVRPRSGSDRSTCTSRTPGSAVARGSTRARRSGAGRSTST